MVGDREININEPPPFDKIDADELHLPMTPWPSPSSN
jgi:hypothetical protein